MRAGVYGLSSFDAPMDTHLPAVSGDVCGPDGVGYLLLNRSPGGSIPPHAGAGLPNTKHLPTKYDAFAGRMRWVIAIVYTQRSLLAR